MTSGFFKLQDLGADYGIIMGKPSVPKASHLSNADSCITCGLHAQTRSPKLGITGKGRLGILYLGEAQGKNEDEQGKQFIGDAGQVLRNTLAQIGLDFERDFFALNSVRCFLSHDVNVYTIEGYKPIKKIQVGDLVLTHKGRFRKVLSRTWDLPNTITKNRQDSYTVSVIRPNNPYPQARGSQTPDNVRVSAGHKFLTDAGWKTVEELSVGDLIKSLGKVCVCCNSVFFVPPASYEKSSNFCSTSCQMHFQYANGLTDKNEITKKAKTKTKELVASGHHNWQNLPQEQRDRSRITMARNLQRENKVLSHHRIVGNNEQEVGTYLNEIGIRFISQFAIHRYNYDFFLPDHHLLIEIDNPAHLNNVSALDRKKLKNDLALELGYSLVRIPSPTAVDCVKRLLKNHDGNYVFADVEVIKIEKRPPAKTDRLYCIEVEEDHSLVAKGIVHHNCRPTAMSDKGNMVNRTPTDNEIAWCWRGTWDLVRKLKPKAVWLAGLVPLQSYLLDKGQEKPTMAKWRSWAIPDQELGCWVIPHYHPSFVHRNPKDKGLANLFRRDLESALAKSKRPFPIYEPMKHISILDEKQAIILLSAIPANVDLLAFDFETTSLKPHREGHDIKYAAVCYNNHSYAFPTRHPELRRLLGEIIAHPDIPLAAHNIQFEDLWSKVILKAEPQNWAWCSQTAAHVLDDRAGITSLEFQAAVRYGDWHFKEDTDPYLKPPSVVDGRKTGCNDFNRIEECPKDKILLRVAKDALYGYWLALDQMQEIQEAPNPMKRGDSVLDMYWLFHDGTLALGDTSADGGLIFDEPYFAEQRKTIMEDVDELEKKILSLPPALLWEEKTGKEINPGSDTQLRTLLFKHYGIKAQSWTDKDNESIGKDVLENYYGHPQLGEFCRLTVEYNKKRKLVSTNIDGFARESVGGIIYPGFSLNIARSGRSSSRNPNFQNIPVRDEWSKQTIRMGLYPHPGHHFLGADYGSHEWRVAACYSSDPVMLDYIIHGGDPHRDQAIELFLLRPDQVTKDLRYEAKSNFIFAELYGSWWKACADKIWLAIVGLKTADGIDIHQHLRNKGIRRLEDFQRHVEQVEKRFWRKFNVLDSWRREWLERYERDGVVPMFHGFQRRGHLSRNQIWNTSIQGTAFHLLLESYIELNRIRKEEGWRSKIIGQIHDEIRSSVHPDELDYILKLHHWVMADWVRQKHSWVIVPLEVEFKVAEIDQPWATESKAV